MNLKKIMAEAGDIAQLVAGGIGVLNATEADGAQKKAVLVSAIVAEAPDLGITMPEKQLRPLVSIAVEALYLLGKLVGALTSGESSQVKPGK